MAWTAATRGDYVRPSGAYASDVTDREWALIAPLLPPARRGGRPRSLWSVGVASAFYELVRAGCIGRLFPWDCPAGRPLYGSCRCWLAPGVGALVHDVPYRRPGALGGRAVSPNAAIIDSDSV